MAVEKVGLFCSIVYTDCQSQSWSNIEPCTTDKYTYGINEETTDASFFLKQCTEI